MKPLPIPPTPRLPSRRASAILAAGMLVAGIALGALLGPGPAASLASGQRAAVVARLLALMALDSGGQSGQPLVSAVSGQPVAGADSAARSVGSTSSGAPSGSPSGAGGHRAASPQTGSAPTSERTPSPPTNRTSSGAGSKPARLPAIGHAWLIVLPYGGSFTKVLAEPTAFPFLSEELSRGTLLSGYSALAAQQLEGAATLISGAVESSVSTIEPPGEPAGAQAADAFLRTVVGEIAATSSYSEGGLIAIAFAGAAASPASPSVPAAGQAQTSPAGTQPSTAQLPSGDAQPVPGEAQPTPGQAQATPYPAGTQASTLSATPTGVLLLSPYLRHAGARLTNAFDAAAPRVSIEELLSTSKSVGR